MVQEYEQYREGRPTYSGHGVFWFDPVASQYVMTWFDSMMGAAFDFRGDFDGDVLRLTHALPGGGFVRATFDCGMPGEYVFMMEVSMDYPPRGSSPLEPPRPRLPPVVQAARRKPTAGRPKLQRPQECRSGGSEWRCWISW